MNLWLSAQEISDLALPGIPNTRQGVEKQAKRDNWREYSALARIRPGREGGGGWEYHIDLLPIWSRLAYVQRFVPTLNVEPVVQAGEAIELGARANRTLRDARLAIVAMADRFCRDTGLSVMSSDRDVAELFNAGKAPISDWVGGTISKVSPRSIARWRSTAKSAGANGLAGDAALNRKGTGVLDTAEGGRLRQWMLGLIASNSHFSADMLRDLCSNKFGREVPGQVEKVIEARGRMVTLPPVRAFQRLASSLRTEHQVLLTKLTNPDKYRSNYLAAGTGTLRYITKPNQLWQIDASPVDALCVDGRHSVYFCIDIATRRVVALISRTPRASAVNLLMRKAIRIFGLPQEVKTDNGSDFVAKEAQRLLDALGIQVTRSHRYSPAEKGHVERAIKTYQHSFAPLLRGYVGHNVADAKQIHETSAFAARLGESDTATFSIEMAGAELQSLTDDWVETKYHHSPHAGLNGQTPFQVAAAADYRPRHVDERALDMLLMPASGKNGLRRVSKFGLKIGTYLYGTPTVLPRAWVFVREDPADMGKVYLYTPDAETYLGEAECPELSGISAAEYWHSVRAKQAELLKQHGDQAKSDLREFKKGPAPIHAVLAERRRRMSNVVPLPRQSDEHTTPKIAAALAAAAAQPAAALNPEAAAIHRDLVNERADFGNVTMLRPSLTPAQLYRKALDLEASLAAGRTVEPEELVWLGGFRASASYQTMKTMHEDFGDQALR